jgi:3-oxoacyl-[acyl-carrier protein] reductase
MAVAFASNGVQVAVNYLRSEDKANQVVEVIRNMGVHAKAFQADVSSHVDVKRLRKEVVDEFGHVDILVNNAGAIVRPAAWDQISPEDIDETLDVNLKGTIYSIQEFASIMMEQQSGRIINLTTTYALTGSAAVLAYVAAKAGVISVTYAMAKELGSSGITVNAIAPGNFDTDMTDSASDAVKKWVIETTPLGRFGQPEEIGSAAVYLAKSDFITGHVLVVDGGQLLNI